MPARGAASRRAKTRLAGRVVIGVVVLEESNGPAQDGGVAELELPAAAGRGLPPPGAPRLGPMRRAAMAAIATMIAAILGRSVGAAVSRGVRLPRQKLELLRRLGLLDVVRT